MDHTVYRFDPLAMTAAADRRPVARVGSGGASTVREPRIGVIYNPRSHRNKGQDLDCTERPGITVARPDRREDIASALADFAQQGIDYLIINGGDGTVRDVLTMGQAVFGETWPALAILPKGKTNALNVDLGAPAGWNLSDAIAAYASGRRIVRRPLSVKREGAGDTPMLGFIFGCGAFTLGVEVGQDAHDLGFFNSLAVGATGAWGVLQALFGSIPGGARWCWRARSKKCRSISSCLRRLARASGWLCSIRHGGGSWELSRQSFWAGDPNGWRRAASISFPRKALRSRWGSRSSSTARVFRQAPMSSGRGPS